MFEMLRMQLMVHIAVSLHIGTARSIARIRSSLSMVCQLNQANIQSVNILSQLCFDTVIFRHTNHVSVNTLSFGQPIIFRSTYYRSINMLSFGQQLCFDQYVIFRVASNTHNTIS